MNVDLADGQILSCLGSDWTKKISGSVERSHNMNTTRNCQMREKVLEVSKKFVM